MAVPSLFKLMRRTSATTPLNNSSVFFLSEQILKRLFLRSSFNTVFSKLGEDAMHEGHVRLGPTGSSAACDGCVWFTSVVCCGAATWGFWVNYCISSNKVAYIHNYISGLYSMKSCISRSWITIKTLLKQMNGFSQQKRLSAFTLKQIQEVLQIFMFVTYSTDRNWNCGERSFSLFCFEHGRSRRDPDSREEKWSDLWAPKSIYTMYYHDFILHIL